MAKKTTGEIHGRVMRKKLRQRRRAVHQRRLGDALRHALQRGDEDHHEEAGVLPDVHDDDRHHGVAAVGQPVHAGQADQAQDNNL